MAYNFTFDLSKLSQTFFREIAEFSEKGKITEKIGDMVINLVKKFIFPMYFNNVKLY